MQSDAALVPMARRPRQSRTRRCSVRSLHRQIMSDMGAVRSASLAVGSASAYRRAVRLWRGFCRHAPLHQHESLDERPGVRLLDQCVCVYLDTIYRRGAGRRRQLGVNTVYGLYYLYPSIRGRLASSEQHLRGWIRLRPPVSRPPLTWPLVTLIAVTMAMNGYGDGALATLVAFDALLRISEVTSLRVRDVSAPSDPRRGRIDSSVSRSVVGTATSGHVLLRLAITKTGRNQWVELTNLSVETLLLQHISGRQDDELVFNLLLPHHSTQAARAYRYALHVVCHRLGLEGQHFTPHSLRHGGATHALLHLRQSVETVLLRGRWQSMSSCRTYLQAGRAQLLQQHIAQSTLALAETVAGDWYNAIHTGLQLPRR
jgi:integrase